MELKKYQRSVIDDLVGYLKALQDTDGITTAYESYWNSKGFVVGFNGIKPYQNNIDGVPNICVKVPTGGGKTFIATCALKPIFDSLPHTKSKAVVWLVPSDAILEQTLRALSDSGHPYRQRLDSDFGHRVEVYSKQQLLTGQNFNPSTVVEQLSVFVLSYDSFRTRTKDGRKAYQENGNLALFAKFFNDPSILLADTDETALIQVIRYLNPVTIVDESHHATTVLSKEMLTNFNPSFVLDLTATPKDDSNIISYVDAVQLKAENMIKLPVIVYNRRNHHDVLADAITIQERLENQAKREHENGGNYIRPIVLLQAQPRNNQDSATFDKLRDALIDCGIPSDQIAIKTADKNEIGGIDLLSETCPIRYIITVNALKEGWDCPFAYVLATIANRSSTVDVEQIVGRILRLPYTRKNKARVLNISYVITSSDNFHETLEQVVAGLNYAGFSDKDYRVGIVDEPIDDPETAAVAVQLAMPEEQEGDSPPNIDSNLIATALAQKSQVDDARLDELDAMLESAVEQAESYELTVETVLSSNEEVVPNELRQKVTYYYINPEFADEIVDVQLPQFVIDSEPSIFSEEETELLTPDRLSEGFRLIDKDIVIDFTTLEAEIARVDIDGSKDAIPKAWKLSSSDNEFFRKWFESKAPEKRIQDCKDMIVSRLSKNNAVNDRDLRDYVERIVTGFSPEQLDDLQQSPYPYALKIEQKVNRLLTEHRKSNFELWLEQGRIRCEPLYSFPLSISPLQVVTTLPNSLYTAEEEMNGLERDVVWEIANLPNIKWWHRNIARKGFSINGYVNAYPDIIAITYSGRLLMIEPKGDHLENEESRRKVEIGRAWQNAAGSQYRYYMVFRNKRLNVDGAYHFDRFMEIIKGLS
ncbi:MAG: DEAD/DEAH box helicase family protein [Coriobacteriia bacterium]|nr:DEAD/DEAH box helicase family protein [Coriobacteriia bacterium]